MRWRVTPVVMAKKRASGPGMKATGTMVVSGSLFLNRQKRVGRVMSQNRGLWEPPLCFRKIAFPGPISMASGRIEDVEARRLWIGSPDMV